MGYAKSALTILPRFTTLVGKGVAPGTSTFTTQPLDVSEYASAEFEFRRGPLCGGATPTFTAFLEESLDGQNWITGAGTSTYGIDPGTNGRFFSYGFRLRWFRLRIVLYGSNTRVTCWAEGLLR